MTISPVDFFFQGDKLGDPTKYYLTYVELKQIAIPDSAGAVLVSGRSSLDDGGGGIFVWDSTDHSATGTNNVPNDPGEGVHVPPGADTTGASGAWVRQYEGAVNIQWFGAHPTASKTTNTSAINNALAFGDAAVMKEVYFPPGTYDVESSNDNTLVPGVWAANRLSITELQSNTRLFGSATLRRDDNLTQNAIIANGKNHPISNVEIDGLAFDGMIATHTGSTRGGIILYQATNYKIRNCEVYDSTGVGIRTVDSVNGHIEDNHVHDLDFIGIQIRNPTKLRLTGNTIKTVASNGFDVEADTAAAEEVIFTNNVVDDSTNSCVFIESCENIIVSNNHLSNAVRGVRLNRINSNAGKSVITGNRMTNVTWGVEANNNVGESVVSDNYIINATAGVSIRGGSRYFYVKGNFFDDISEALININQAAVEAAWSYIETQVHAKPRVNGKPFTVSPVDNPDNFANRDSQVRFEAPAMFLQGGQAASLEDEYKTGATGTLDQNSAWSNAYSIFSGGETLVYESSGTMTVGRYVTINGSLFYVHAGSAGEYTVRDHNKVAGDYTATTNGAHAWVEYWPEWQEA